MPSPTDSIVRPDKIFWTHSTLTNFSLQIRKPRTQRKRTGTITIHSHGNERADPARAPAPCQPRYAPLRWTASARSKATLPPTPRRKNSGKPTWKVSGCSGGKSLLPGALTIHESTFWTTCIETTRTLGRSTLGICLDLTMCSKINPVGIIPLHLRSQFCLGNIRYSRVVDPRRVMRLFGVRTGKAMRT